MSWSRLFVSNLHLCCKLLTLAQSVGTQDLLRPLGSVDWSLERGWFTSHLLRCPWASHWSPPLLPGALKGATFTLWSLSIKACLQVLHVHAWVFKSDHVSCVQPVMCKTTGCTTRISPLGANPLFMARCRCSAITELWQSNQCYDRKKGHNPLHIDHVSPATPPLVKG